MFVYIIVEKITGDLVGVFENRSDMMTYIRKNGVEGVEYRMFDAEVTKCGGVK